MKTSFELPASLMRRAKAAAARGGRPLRDLVAEAIERLLESQPSEIAESGAAVAERRSAWERWRSRRIELPDGSLFDPESSADDDWFALLDAIRAERWPEPDAPANDAADR